MSESIGTDSTSDYDTSNTIRIPGFLPKLMTDWSKAGMRTEPSYLLGWSAIYFRMKGNGEYPPIKPYVDPPDVKLGPGGLTPNALKALAMSLTNELETYTKIKKIWDILSLGENVLSEIVRVGQFREKIKRHEFIGIAAGHLNNRLRDTMILLCDTLSKDDSRSIPLDEFVAVYEYLARLNCSDTARSEYEYPTHYGEEKIDRSEEGTGNSGSQCFRSTDSHASSALLEEPSPCDYSVSVETDGGDEPNTTSAIGIMVWNDKTAQSEWDLSGPTVAPPTTTAMCDDPDYLKTLRRLAEKRDEPEDLLSLLSASSVISEPDDGSDVISCCSASDLTRRPSDSVTFEELEGEEAFGEQAYGDAYWLRSKRSYYDDGAEGGRRNVGASDEVDEMDENNVDENAAFEVDDEANAAATAAAAAAAAARYDEDDKNDKDGPANDEAGKPDADKPDAGKLDAGKLAAEANKDFVVMLALVGDDIGPTYGNNYAGEADGGSGGEEELQNESSESEFSLLNNVELLNERAADRTDGDDGNANAQRFEENYYVAADRESTDGGTSSASDESEYSEVDGHRSVGSAAPDKTSDGPERSGSEIMSEDLASDHPAGGGDRRPLADDELYSMNEYYGLDETAGEGERYDDGDADEYEKCSNFGKPGSAAESYRSRAPDETETEGAKDACNALPGIGPTVPEKRIRRVVLWVTRCAEKQNGRVLDHNLMHFMCPSLDHHLSNDDELGVF